MASLSSSSVSSSSSLGNTSLRGFGGLASGIDRDAIIEQMSLGTQTKIDNQKSAMTRLEWKQEAYRNITDQILDLTDKYASYSSTSNLKDTNLFAKNQITVQGSESATRFVTATGTSKLIDNISIAGVRQMATSSIMRSGSHVADAIRTDKIDLSKEGKTWMSKLTTAEMKIVSTNGDGTSNPVATFKFKEKDKDGNYIDYIPTDADLDEDGNVDAQKYAERLAGIFNDLAEDQDLKDRISFTAKDGKLEVELKGDDKYSKESLAIQKSYATDALGFGGDDKYIKSGQAVSNLIDSAAYKKDTIGALAGNKLIFEYNGDQKYIDFISKEDEEAIKALDDPDARADMIVQKLQERLDAAFGSMAEADDGSVAAGIRVRKDESEDGSISFKFETKGNSTLSLLSTDSAFMKSLGLDFGESNKVNVDGKLDQAALGLNVEDYLDGDNLKLTINGKAITGLTKDSTIGDIINKINSTKGAGVKATYVDATGEFMLVSSETGSGRQIKLDSPLAEDLFGGGSFKAGQDAIVMVNYGNGVNIEVERSSNTFGLEGLTVSVSGEFGYRKNDAGEYYIDSATGEYAMDTSQRVSFTAKADVDKAVETVKTFIEDYNKLVTEVRSQATSRPDSSYGPLTSAQKDEMDETSIENWEKKAKQGILFGDDVIRGLSGDLEGVMAGLLMNGFNYQDLEEMGITYSEDYLDGGTIVFDEAKFRQAVEKDPDKVSDIITGGDKGNGLINVVEKTLTPYATRYASKNGNSYGRLVEVAGTEKKPTSLMSNQIYKQLKQMQETIDKLQSQLQVEQDRYIKQFSTMESLINNMNTQSSYLSSIMA